MKRLAFILLLAGGATAASAQLLDGSAGVGAHVGGAVGAAPGAVVDSTMRGATDAVQDAGRAAGDTTRAASKAADVNVHAGASTRVARSTRCYDGYDYWDPYYRDGSYYCETRGGPGVAVGAKVKTGG